MEGNLLDELIRQGLTDEELSAFVRSLPPHRKAELRERVFDAAGVGGAYAFDPVRYVREQLRENLWSKQAEILRSVRDNPRTAVPACFGGGKSFLAARAISWWVDSWPVGAAGAVTTATTFRSVKGQLWGHVRRLHRQHLLRGRVNQVEWWEGQELLALGFSAPDTDPESVQGWHWPHTLVVVDEAGGISEAIGRALESLLSTGHARMLAIGNPSMDEQDSWFERVCSSDRWNVIRLDARSTPNFTGEATGECRTCPGSPAPHKVASHLITKDWVEDVVAEYGEEDPYVVSRVDAQFPEVVANVVIPRGWVQEAAQAKVEDVGEGHVVALGVDVAADGGDELAIGRREGFTLRLVHHQSGRALANSVDVAGIVLEHVLAAEELAKKLGHEEPVHVKVDVIGVGLGVCSVLEKWGPLGEQRHRSEVVRVNVAERAGDPEAYANKRAEMWWTGRKAFEPAGEGGAVEFRLVADSKTQKQLSDPTYGRTSTGKRLIESKQALSERGKGSPDRAEGILLALYEPQPSRRKLEIIL